MHLWFIRASGRWTVDPTTNCRPQAIIPLRKAGGPGTYHVPGPPQDLGGASGGTLLVWTFRISSLPLLSEVFSCELVLPAMCLERLLMPSLVICRGLGLRYTSSVHHLTLRKAAAPICFSRRPRSGPFPRSALWWARLSPGGPPPGGERP